MLRDWSLESTFAGQMLVAQMRWERMGNFATFYTAGTVTVWCWDTEVNFPSVLSMCHTPETLPQHQHKYIEKILKIDLQR